MPMIYSLCIMFLQIGFFSFGGGYVMLPLIYQNIQEFGVMSASEFSDLVALSQITPGPIAINAATYVGYNSAGIAGAVAATISVAIPSFILVILVSHFMNRFKQSQGLNAVLAGIRPATIGLLAAAVVFLSETSIFSEGAFSKLFFSDPAAYINLVPMAFFLVTVVLSAKFRISPILLTIVSAIVGAAIIR